MYLERQPLCRNEALKAGAIVLVCVLFLVASAGAKPVPITGPVVITEPGQYYLANNILDSTEPVCILVQTSNVVIDGRGKTIDGTDAPDSIGIRVYNAAMTLVNVVIKNIKVNDWNIGILLTDVRDSVIDKATVTSCNLDGVRLFNSHWNTVQNSVSRDNGGAGFLLFGGSSGNMVQGVTGQANGNDGIRIFQANNNDVQKSKFIGNARGGINLNDVSDFNSLGLNTLTGNMYGILMQKSSNNIIISNTIKDNEHGIYVYSDSINNKITKNTVTNCDSDGLRLLTGTDSNVVAGNTFDKNGRYGIYITEGDRNIMYNNLVRNNVNAGITMRSSEKNVFFNNYFYNVNNTDIIATTSYANVWNLSLSEQRSITSGKYSGGNSWGQPNGQGFSQVTPDTNRDGICDSPFPIAANNIDNYPLKWKSVR